MAAQLPGTSPTTSPATISVAVPKNLPVIVPSSRLQQARRQIMSGGAAGFVEVCCMHPLDVVKTRLQIQSRTSADRYRSVGDCFRRMYTSEGSLSFYKGILPPILAETPKRAVKFVCFEQYKNLLTGNGQTAATPLVYSAAGFGCGLTEALVINPFEVVKVSLQAQKGSHSVRTTTMEMARDVYRAGGLGRQGLGRGITATLGRHGVWNGVYFGLYHSAKPSLPPAADGRTQNILGRLALGLAAGTLASTANIPFDVAKSRIQGPQPDGVRRYHSTVQTMALIYREEGVRALYTGLVPKVMRLGPGGAIMLVIYESVSDWLLRHGI
ncbi:mitochondrial 2-oxodicarboxylate carrier-like [Sycon ciliatum]|uniref:mitochondrial 2-oxodicarboxylate carrier-like n=1 Tax=Sycon ciliatum TaxID=27933 RepID=UPI0020A9CC97|eukprot:scpid76703/ scgid21452/ Mitochondrial 2-oxodicarboxylate carrier; Solute carrier family 25 member 21